MRWANAHQPVAVDERTTRNSSLCFCCWLWYWRWRIRHSCTYRVEFVGKERCKILSRVARVVVVVVVDRNKKHRYHGPKCLRLSFRQWSFSLKPESRTTVYDNVAIICCQARRLWWTITYTRLLVMSNVAIILFILFLFIYKWQRATSATNVSYSRPTSNIKIMHCTAGHVECSYHFGVARWSFYTGSVSKTTVL